MRTVATVAVVVLVVTGAVAGVAGVGASSSANTSSVGSQDADSSTYAGTHVAFEASGNSLTDYRVGNETVFQSLAVESKDSHQSQADVGASIGLEAVTNLDGLGLSIASQTETRAEIQTEGSAGISAHDTERGILTVDAGEDGQYVEVGLDGTANASADGDRVVLERNGSDSSEGEDGTDGKHGVFLVVGDGEVTVNEEGNVSADLESESKLVFRSYDEGERDEDAREQESLIANGTATAEVYAEQRDGEFVADAATYGEDVAVEATQVSEERVEMTVERAQSEGTVVITSVSESAVENLENLAVTVDGEAAVEASSYSELEGAIGSDESRYVVSQGSEASASADVLVAVNHFSERTVAMDSSGDEPDGSTDETSDESDDGIGGADGSPGFGVVTALLAVLAAAGTRLCG